MKKRILGVAFGAVIVFTVNFSATTNVEAKMGPGDMHVCPGSGEECNATITMGGDTVTVKSKKNKGGGTIVIEK